MYFTLYRKDELKLEGMLLNVVDFEWLGVSFFIQESQLS